MSEPAEHVPTIDDLRVKLCYICREEERHDEPVEHPKDWVHPCQCTLVAHESCLLTWIRAAQSDPNRARNALKCPQCGAGYELESEKPVPLRILKLLDDTTLNYAAKIMKWSTITFGVVTVGGCIYAWCTTYGAYAVHQFLGKEMFDIFLTDDASNWPWHAYINLPLIPLSLILSRTSLVDTIVPILPLFIAWPTSPPVHTSERTFVSRWARTGNNQPPNTSDVQPFSLLTWPPAPLVACFLFPFTRRMYSHYFSAFSHWLLGTRPTERQRARRLEWALNEDEPGALRIRIGANVEDRRDRRRNEGDAPAEGGGGGEDAEEDLDLEPRTRLTGRLIIGALLIPTISNYMGSMLLRLSKHSVLLRRFLAVKPPLNGIPFVAPLGLASDDDYWVGMKPIRQAIVGARLALSVFLSGTRTWAECDPVWWRNSIGLGIFVVAKDCFELYYRWLSKRELESRKVKNRSFEGVDPRELDLIDRPAPQA